MYTERYSIAIEAQRRSRPRLFMFVGEPRREKSKRLGFIGQSKSDRDLGWDGRSVKRGKNQSVTAKDQARGDSARHSCREM